MYLYQVSILNDAKGKFPRLYRYTGRIILTVCTRKLLRAIDEGGRLKQGRFLRAVPDQHNPMAKFFAQEKQAYQSGFYKTCFFTVLDAAPPLVTCSHVLSGETLHKTL